VAVMGRINDLPAGMVTLPIGSMIGAVQPDPVAKIANNKAAVYRLRALVKNARVVFGSKFFFMAGIVGGIAAGGNLVLRSVRHPCLTWRAASLPPGTGVGWVGSHGYSHAPRLVRGSFRRAGKPGSTAGKDARR